MWLQLKKNKKEEAFLFFSSPDFATRLHMSVQYWRDQFKGTEHHQQLFFPVCSMSLDTKKTWAECIKTKRTCATVRGKPCHMHTHRHAQWQTHARSEWPAKLTVAKTTTTDYRTLFLWKQRMPKGDGALIRIIEYKEEGWGRLGGQRTRKKERMRERSWSENLGFFIFAFLFFFFFNCLAFSANHCHDQSCAYVSFGNTQ